LERRRRSICVIDQSRSCRARQLDWRDNLEDLMTGTPSQIEWAEQIKLRIDAELDRVGQGPHGGSQHADGFGSSRFSERDRDSQRETSKQWRKIRPAISSGNGRN